MNRNESKPNIYVRRAHAFDREAVFKFCEKTWSWGDYVPKVWDEWLKERKGRVFVAIIDGVPVGITHLSIDKPNEAWLSAARTDPNYRRLGVATVITQKCLEYAKRKGAKVVRLATESDNMAAKAVVQKLGFQPTAEFVEMVAENVTEERSRNSKWAKENETDVIWNYVQSSETYRKAAGLYTVLFHYFSLGKQDLRQFIEQRKAILHIDEDKEIDGITLIDDATAREWRENTMQTCYVDGDYGAVPDMVGLLKSHCFASGVKKIYGFTCNRKPIVATLEKLGFKLPDSIDIVYEKKL
jgi:ribosomal protein S18 acetylase RimI-like enzyme